VVSDTSGNTDAAQQLMAAPLSLAEAFEHLSMLSRAPHRGCERYRQGVFVMSERETTVMRWWHSAGEPEFGDFHEPILEIRPSMETPRAFEPILIDDPDDGDALEITIH
jgi:hypothetical protein